MNIDEYLDDEQLKVVGLLGVVVLAIVGAPMLLAPSDDGEIEPNNGTIVTPDGTTLEEVTDPDRGPLDGLNALPASHLRDDKSPTVHASAGAQTMRVETTTVDGEPALNLSDERTHDGRWVSVPTDWFNRTQGEVPSVARIAHEENGTYTEAIQVRGDSAAFYVRGFSTNTVTFGGELVIRDRPAADGTRHTYQLDSRDSVGELSINVTGVDSTERQSLSSARSDGETVNIDTGGNAQPANESVTFTGRQSTDSGSTSGTISDTSSESLSIGGNQQTTVELTITPQTQSGSETFPQYDQEGAIDVSNTDYINSMTIPAIDYQSNSEETELWTGSGQTGTKLAERKGSDAQFPVEYTDIDVSDQDTIYLYSTDNFGNYDELSWNGVTPVQNPTVTIGSSTESASTMYSSATLDITVSPGDKTLNLDTSHPVTADYSASWSEQTVTEDPQVTVDGQKASYSGVLSEGETVTKSIDLTLGSQTGTVSTQGSVGVSVDWTEVTETRDPIVEVNSESVGVDGTLADGETVSLNASSSWLRDGTNNVSVHVGDGSAGSGPEPQVDVEYRHDLESPRTVNYQSEALSERYNISKTYTTAREGATLTIPHARTVLSMRSLEYRLNETGTYSSVPQSASNLSGTTLTVDVSDLAGDPVPEGTTVEIRSVGSRVDAHNAEISVVQATPVGFDLDSRVRFDSWNSDSYLGVGGTAQGALVHYGIDETWSTESDYVELYGDGSQRLYAPNASSGSELTLNTLDARVSPDRNSMRVRVPESANATNTEFVVEPASVVGDAWNAEYVAGTDGQWYAVVDSAGEELGAAEKPDPIEVSRDDVGLVSIVPTDPPSASTDSVGGGIFATVTDGNLPSLLALFGGVGMLFVAGTRPENSRDAVDAVASSIDSVVSRIPRVGGPLGSAVESAVSAVGSGLVSVGENRLLTGAVGAAIAVAAAEAGLFTIGSETGAILAVAGIAVGSLFLLREAEAFTTARWIAVVAVAGVVALQGLGEGDLLTELVNSDAFLILVLIGGYALIQLVREYRANNNPNDDRPQVIIGGNIRSGGDDEGSD